MSKIPDEWIEAFNILDPIIGPKNFSLFVCVLKDIESTKNNHIIDEKNQLEIDKRVSVRTNGLEEENSELKAENSELEEENCELEEKKSGLEQELNSANGKINSLRITEENNIKMGQDMQKKSDEKVFEIIEKENEQLKNKINDKDKLIADYIKQNNNKSSYEKGVEGEDILYEILQKESEFNIKETSRGSHKGDFIIEYKKNRFCLDAKNYITNVPGDEVLKISDDIIATECDGGAIISFYSGILDPDKHSMTRNHLDRLSTTGRPVLLFSFASKCTPEYINSSLKMFFNEIRDKNNSQINEKHFEILINLIKSLASSIKKEEESIETEQKSFINRIKKREKALKIRKHELDYFKSEIDNHNELSEDESPEDELSEDEPCENNDKTIKIPSAGGKKYPPVKEMREQLTELGHDVADLKCKALKGKYNELFSINLSP